MMRIYKRTPAEDLHFPEPMSTIELAELHYDPTYGDTDPTSYHAAVCSTCSAIVPTSHVADHAEWHNQEGHAPR